MSTARKNDGMMSASSSTYANDTIGIDDEGEAIGAYDVATATSTAAADLALAIDPSEIEIVPLAEGDDAAVPGRPAFDFVKMFRGSAKYIANHRNTMVVYHIPGELLEWDGFADLCDDIALTWLLGMKIVIVCGCRHQIDVRLGGEEEEEVVDGNDNDRHHEMGEPGEDDLDGIRASAGNARHNSVRVTDLDTLPSSRRRPDTCASRWRGSSLEA